MVASVTLRPSAARLRWVQRLDRSQPPRPCVSRFWRHRAGILILDRGKGSQSPHRPEEGAEEWGTHFFRNDLILRVPRPCLAFSARQGGDFDFDEQPIQSRTVLVSVPSTRTRSPQLHQHPLRSEQSCSTSNLRDGGDFDFLYPDPKSKSPPCVSKNGRHKDGAPSKLVFF